MNPVHHIEFPTIAVGLNKIKPCKYGVMVFLSSDTTIGKALDLYGEFAEESNIFMRQLVREGDTIVDVGANVGTVTACMAQRVGATGRVYAIEPQRIIFQNLCATIALNGWTNVYSIQAAVGEAVGSIAVPQINYANADNFGALSLTSEGGSDRVNSISIDSLNLDRCNLIKIDVEGMELDVLKGAISTLKQHQPSLYLEAKKGLKTQASIQLLQDLGYQLYWHFAYFFRSNNYRGTTQNVFGFAGDINILAIPAAIDVQVDLPRIIDRHEDWQAAYSAWMAQRSNTINPAP
jgi:FkbM family methyltransferase